MKKLVVLVNVYSSGSSGDGFEEKVAMFVKDVKSIRPKMALTDENTGKSATKLTR